MQTADRIERRIKAMGLTDTESAKVLSRFREARQERRGWEIAGAVLVLLTVCSGWKVYQWLRRRRIQCQIAVGPA